jgi:glycosyltransferase involved in cell wall biosynthesis
VYLNAENISPLLAAVTKLAEDLDGDLEVVFVVDGSPDDSFARLTEGLSRLQLKAQVLVHSRNFGSFAAIRTGMEAAHGQHIAVMAADLQDPIELIEQFYAALSEDRADLVVGTRASRNDGRTKDAMSRAYWRLARRIISDELPRGGVDVFACNAVVRDALLQMREQRSSMIGQLYWLGFRREEVPYHRRERDVGASGWTLRRKINYLLDSFFSFTDLPIRILTTVGAIGLIVAFVLTVTVLVGRATGAITVPGYTAIVLVIVGFSALNLLSLGVVGNYVYRTYENTKQRPLALVSGQIEFPAKKLEHSE